MRTMTLIILVVSGLHASADDSENAPVQQPEDQKPVSFAQALKAADEIYLDKLKEALAAALNEDKQDDAIHIRRRIEMEKLRSALTGTRWTRNRPNDPDSIHFKENRIIMTGKGTSGVWDVVEEHVVAVRFGSTGQDLWLYKFNDDLTSYELRAYIYNPRTNYSGGRKIGR